MASSITESELLAALASAVTSDAPEDARTAQELSRETGIPVTRVRVGLQALQRDNRLMVHPVMRRRIDGAGSIVPAYTVLPPSKPKRGKK